jgi:hypothetical protein
MSVARAVLLRQFARDSSEPEALSAQLTQTEGGKAHRHTQGQADFVGRVAAHFLMGATRLEIWRRMAVLQDVAVSRWSGLTNTWWSTTASFWSIRLPAKWSRQPARNKRRPANDPASQRWPVLLIFFGAAFTFRPQSRYARCGCAGFSALLGPY